MELATAALEPAHGVPARPDSLTVLLSRVTAGDAEAFNDVFPLIYNDLHRIAEGCMRGERPNHTLQATALIHELYVRLLHSHDLVYRSQGHFLALAARIMRRILVDHARTNHAVKRGPGIKTRLDENLSTPAQQEPMVVQLDDALRQLEKEDRMKGRLIEMRFFAGMTAADIAESLAMPVHTVRRQLRFSQAWIRRQMSHEIRSR
jgi:RNA polymerase sigma factor (TIGR02999 family)